MKFYVLLSAIALSILSSGFVSAIDPMDQSGDEDSSASSTVPTASSTVPTALSTVPTGTTSSTTPPPTRGGLPVPDFGSHRTVPNFGSNASRDRISMEVDDSYNPQNCRQRIIDGQLYLLEILGVAVVRDPSRLPNRVYNSLDDAIKAAVRENREEFRYLDGCNLFRARLVR